LILKSIDLSLMAEHLSAHKGILNKLESFYCSASEGELKQLIYEQYVIMRNHVKVMILLMDPEHNEEIKVDSLNHIEPVTIQCPNSISHNKDEDIALELKHTAKTMAHNNFSSALMMKAKNVKDIHIHMALQQTMLHHRFNQFLKKNTSDTAPDSSFQEQLETLTQFKKMFPFVK
jgi:hypothetical protein